MDDVDALAAALRRISADRASWDRMAQAGNRHARARFDQRASVDAMIDLYRSSVNARKRGGA
jgi:glycosyltransferase involved in cell wall biosynthesis